MTPELEELYQQVILDHSRHPRNRGELTDAIRVHGDNPSCGDEIDLSVRFGADGQIDDLKFLGHGCAISQASASLMTLKLRGKSRAEAETMLRSFHGLVTGGESDGAPGLGDLQLMAGVKRFPQRVKCAMLAWRAFEQALEQGTTPSDATGPVSVSTEEPAS